METTPGSNVNEATKLATEEAQEEAKEGMEGWNTDWKISGMHKMSVFPCRTCSFFEIVGTPFDYLMYIKVMDDEL